MWGRGEKKPEQIKGNLDNGGGKWIMYENNILLMRVVWYQQTETDSPRKLGSATRTDTSVCVGTHDLFLFSLSFFFFPSPFLTPFLSPSAHSERVFSKEKKKEDDFGELNTVFYRRNVRPYGHLCGQHFSNTTTNGNRSYQSIQFTMKMKALVSKKKRKKKKKNGAKTTIEKLQIRFNLYTPRRGSTDSEKLQS